MNKLIRFYNQNRKKILVIGLIIIFGIALLQLLNYFAKTQKDNLPENYSTDDVSVYQPDRSLVTGSIVPEKNFSKQSSLINNFMEYCNNGKIQEAYVLLSDDCKNILYPSLEEFKTKYYNIIFNQKRKYSIENWTGDIYRIDMTEDILATGKSNEGLVTQDYFTIVSQESELKLNISKLIKVEELNKEKKDSNLLVKVKKREVYMDYEVYDFEIKNVSNQKIELDSLENTDSIYITDNNNINYYSYSNELSKELFEIERGHINEISIRFSNPYIHDRKIESLTFSDVGKLREERTEFSGVLTYRDVETFSISL